MPRAPIAHSVTPRVERALLDLGASVRTARLARNMTQAELAQRGGMGLATLKRLEAGHAGVAVGHLLACLDLLNLMSLFVASVAPAADGEGQARRTLARERARRKGSDEYDF